MKILYYSPHPHLHIEDQTGYGTHMREMIGAFEELGHQVKFLIAGEQTMRPQASVTSLQKPSHLINFSMLRQLIYMSLDFLN